MQATRASPDENGAARNGILADAHASRSISSAKIEIADDSRSSRQTAQRNGRFNFKPRSTKRQRARNRPFASVKTEGERTVQRTDSLQPMQKVQPKFSMITTTASVSLGRADCGLARAALMVSWVALALGIVAGAWAPALAQLWGAPLLIAGGLAFGMPHGAGDWLLMRARSRSQAQLARWTLLYLALAVAVGALWFWSAPWALGFFLALTAWHWGSGDAHWLDDAQRDGRRGARPDAPWLLFAVGRGLLVMAAPLALRAPQSAQFLRAIAQLTARNGAPLPIEGALQVAPLALQLALFCSALAWLWLELRARDCALDCGRARRARALVGAESAGLLLLFWAAPPLFAVALYFAAVHAWRHILRVQQLRAVPLCGARQIARGVARFHWSVAPITALALAGMAPLLWLWPQIAGNARALSAAYLVLISALTLPHALILLWLDWRS